MAKRKAQKSPDEMTFLEHLEDLRKRLFNAFLAVVLGVIPGWYFSKPVYNILARPVTEHLPEGTKLAFTTLTAPFMLYLKVAFLTSIFVTSPFIFLQLWYFIQPGLYRKERKYVFPFVFFTSFFFISGALFGYFVVFPWAVRFFLTLGAEFQPVITVDMYFNFVLKVLLGIALVFELPTLIFFLSKLGIVTARWMVKNFKYAVLAAFVISALVTTPDVVTQTLVAVPLLALYGISIIIAHFVGKGREKKRRDEDGGGNAGERKKTRKEKKAEKAAEKSAKKARKKARGEDGHKSEANGSGGAGGEETPRGDETQGGDAEVKDDRGDKETPDTSRQDNGKKRTNPDKRPGDDTKPIGKKTDADGGDTGGGYPDE